MDEAQNAAVDGDCPIWLSAYAARATLLSMMYAVCPYLSKLISLTIADNI
jgi:hypothetical protein